MMSREQKLLALLSQFHSLGIDQQIDYNKFYLYSLITNSTAIEGSTVTEIENQLLFDEDISAKGRSMTEQLMNLDLKAAYEQSIVFAKSHTDITVELLKKLSSVVMKNTGTIYNTALGEFSSANGDLRLLNVTTGVGGHSYMNYSKVPSKLSEFCINLNNRRKTLLKSNILECYRLSFDAHYQLVTIHPWVDGNGRISRLLMNQLQFELDIIPVNINKERRGEYIQTLVSTREEEDLNIFRNFMFDEHIRNLEQLIHNYKASIANDDIGDTAKIAKSDVLNDVLKSSKRTESIILAIQSNPNITIDQIAVTLRLSKPTIEREISFLKSKGMLSRIGSKKAGIWQINR